ncbi:hypothetical protein SKAU_G00047450 [Synaphobranchus kaupii]|uniref:Uncharacterized protein n=1 Tax=Synaphobranchus kaupii TaxID=118154 RepID=A0A9Q1G3N5_SYNKA|nr:hypothetical protein SKAU_G00047450 [Synaphobranchus kaupii]
MRPDLARVGARKRRRQRSVRLPDVSGARQTAGTVVTARRSRGNAKGREICKDYSCERGFPDPPPPPPFSASLTTQFFLDAMATGTLPSPVHVRHLSGSARRRPAERRRGRGSF